MTLDLRLAGFMSALTPDTVPADVRAEARRMLLDTIGCTITARATEIAPVVDSLTPLLGGRHALLASTYRLARLADSMDFNEGYGGAHFGCGAVAAVLALAREKTVSGEQALNAIIAGFETGARILDATGPYYTTDAEGRQRFAPVWGIAAPVVFAAAGAAARLLGFDAAETARAYALAGSSAPIPIGGQWSSEIDLPNTKYCDAGWCAVAGVFGALSVRSGSTGVRSLLNGPGELYDMVGAPNAQPELAVAQLGEVWRMRAIRYKIFPACGLVTALIRTLKACLDENGIDVAGIEAVDAEVGSAIVIPRFANTDPATFVSRQFSLPHAATMLALGIASGPAWLSPRIASHPRVEDLRSRFRLRALEDDWSTSDETELRPARVTVLADGRTYRRDSRGLAPPRWDDAAIQQKFSALVTAPHATAIIRAVTEIETLLDLGPLLDLLDAAQPVSGEAAALAHLDTLLEPAA